MGRGRNGSLPEKGENVEEEIKFKGKARENSGSESDSKEDRKRSKTKRKAREKSESHSESVTEAEEERKRRRKSGKGKSKSDVKTRKRHSSEEEDSDSQSDYSSDSKSEYSDSEERESESEEGRRRREEEDERERERKRRRREKEKKNKSRRRREKEEERERKRKRKEKRKKKRLERGKKGAVTNSWGKYGIIRETDMWNKRPEFTAWLAEVKQVNLESLPTWEEKLMFKQFMEDHNTATFPSKKYYNLDAYYKREMEKEMKRGFKEASQKERTVFNDEEQRRLELQQAREKQKEEEVEALKCSMQSGMAQAMREQAQLREEMAYQYKLGNFEAAAAIQRRLDPDIAM